MRSVGGQYNLCIRIWFNTCRALHAQDQEPGAAGDRAGPTEERVRHHVVQEMGFVAEQAQENQGDTGGQAFLQGLPQRA